MRVILHQDVSTVIDDVQLDLSHGKNTFRLTLPQFEKDSLTLETNYPYQIHSVSGSPSLYEITVVTNGADVGLTHIPVIYDTNLITSRISYVYDIPSEEGTATVRIVNKMPDPVTAEFSLGTHNGEYEYTYTILSTYTIQAGDTLVLPISGISMENLYVVDLMNEKTYDIVHIMDEHPIYPGSITVTGFNPVPVVRGQVDETGYFLVGQTDTITVESVGNMQLQRNPPISAVNVIIDNNAVANADITLIGVSDVKNFRVTDPDDQEVPAVENNVSGEEQISFKATGIGRYNISLQ